MKILCYNMPIHDTRGRNDMLDYTPELDLACIVFAGVFLLVLRESYIKFSTNFVVFKISVGLICFCSAMKVFYYSVTQGSNNAILRYSFSMLYSVGLLILMQLYVAYISRITIWNREVVLFVTGLSDVGCVIAAIINPYLPNLLFVAYCINVGAMLYCCLKNDRCVFRQMRYALCVVSFVSIFMVMYEHMLNHSIFTVFTFFLPLLVVMFMVHSNPYNLTTGALNAESFDEFLKNKKKKTKMLVIKLRDYQFGHLPEDLEFLGKKCCAGLKKASVFNPLPDTLVIISRDIGAARKAAELFEMAKKLYYADDITDISGLDYFRDLAALLDREHGWDTSSEVTEADFEKINHKQECLVRLREIYDAYDLDDPHVLAYCQPIKNIRTGEYNTAEALMRIQLDDLGFLYPNDFIPILEEYELIHRFSMIMLNKVCEAVRELAVARVSVNFSVEELRDTNFMKDFCAVVRKNGVPFKKIGVEFTESRNDTDFETLREAVKELHGFGCTVYLDDFGTGYSNFERVLGLNMNVIKFDRSLLLLATSSCNGKYVISSFSETFEKMGMEILYEGVETEEQEALCINSNADYLQGYKYSKPIPIEHLREFSGALETA